MMSRCSLKHRHRMGPRTTGHFRRDDETSQPVHDKLRGARASPQCGRAEAIRQVETIRPILDRLYPVGQSENTTSKNDEFKSERDASRRLLARLDNHEEVSARLGGVDASPRIAASLHHLVWGAAKVQWSVGHRHEAVLAAAKAVNSQLQAKIGRRDVSEVDRVKQAFSEEKAPEPAKPRLRFTSIGDEQTAKSMQGGVLEFGSGCFRACDPQPGWAPPQ